MFAQLLPENDGSILVSEFVWGKGKRYAMKCVCLQNTLLLICKSEVKEEKSLSSLCFIADDVFHFVQLNILQKVVVFLSLIVVLACDMGYVFLPLCG